MNKYQKLKAFILKRANHIESIANSSDEEPLEITGRAKELNEIMKLIIELDKE